ncbi:MAG TPA: GntR family transcriptional regulator [Devosia sp.]|nr:GntR family transcriptional regulator [Devosia sp.]
MAKSKLAQAVLVDESGLVEGKRKRMNSANLFALAYDRIEELIVNCTLRPGAFLSIQDVQDASGFSRTPVHQAVSRLAQDTLIVIRPRHGLQIAPIDLARDRLLLQLRRDMERFVLRLACERASSAERHRMLYLTRALRERRADLSIDEFNLIDQRIDFLIQSASKEPFLENTLRPLHTVFRRIGFLHHKFIAGASTLQRSIDGHMAVLDAVANRRTDDAVKASDELMNFVDAMFDEMELQIDPAQLDCSIQPLL